MQAAGFAMMGAIFGIGWGYGIGTRPDDTSLLGNIIATLGVIAILAGMTLSILPAFISLSWDTAFLYLVLINGLILLCYGIASTVNQLRVASPPEPEVIEKDELML